MGKSPDLVASTRALSKFLAETATDGALSTPQVPGLKQILSSQGRMAKLSLSSRGIIATSLNTLKRTAAVAIAGGFAELDQLRKAALQAVASAERAAISKRDTRQTLQVRICRLEADNQSLLEDLLLLTQLLQKSMEHARSYASSSQREILPSLCKKQQREILATMSCLRRQSNVVQLKRE